jgi:hypothetical protein
VVYSWGFEGWGRGCTLSLQIQCLPKRRICIFVWHFITY